MNKRILISATAAIFGLFLVGCTPEARDKYDAAGDNLAAGAAKTGDAMATDAAKTGQAVEKGAEAAGEAVKNTAENTAKLADNGQTTLAVKNAILTSKGLESSNLNVDTKDKQIILRGSVPTEDQKKQAETIAKGIAGKEYTVTNQLTIAPK